MDGKCPSVGFFFSHLQVGVGGAAGSLESFHFQKRIYPHFPSLSVGEREEKIETHTVMCLCDKKRRAQAESQGGEKKSKKTEKKSQRKLRKRKSLFQLSSAPTEASADPLGPL